MVRMDVHCFLCQAGVRATGLSPRMEYVFSGPKLVSVCSGMIKLVGRDGRGRRFCFWIFGPGDLIPVTSLERLCLSLEPVSASSVHLVSPAASSWRPDFARRLETFGKLIYLRTFELGTKPVQEDLKLVLSRLARRFGRWRGDGWELPSIRRKDIREIIGCSPQMLAKAMAKLEGQGLIERRGKLIFVGRGLAGEPDAKCGAGHSPTKGCGRSRGSGLVGK